MVKEEERNLLIQAGKSMDLAGAELSKYVQTECERIDNLERDREMLPEKREG